MAKKHKKKGGFPWVPVGVAAAAVAVVAGMASSAKAATTPLEPYEDPGLTRKQAAQAMSDKLHAIITAKGFTVYPAYAEATSETEGISDPTGKRNLAVENQSNYEKWYGFMWSTNGILRFNNYDVTDPAKWAAYIDQYKAALLYLQNI